MTETYMDKFLYNPRNRWEHCSTVFRQYATDKLIDLSKDHSDNLHIHLGIPKQSANMLLNSFKSYKLSTLERYFSKFNYSLKPLYDKVIRASTVRSRYLAYCKNHSFDVIKSDDFARIAYVCGYMLFNLKLNRIKNERHMFDGQMRSSGLIEWNCEHGIGHPAPFQMLKNVNLIHGCDGCCSKWVWPGDKK